MVKMNRITLVVFAILIIAAASLGWYSYCKKILGRVRKLLE